jgi:hypothetical protein
MKHITWLGLAWLCCALHPAPASAQQVPLPRVEQMPNLPQPYALRDWTQTARDFDKFAFDPNLKGDHLPAFWWDKRCFNLTDQDSFAMAAYVGMFHSNPQTMAFDTITCLGAVIGGSLAGIDKSNQDGHNWVRMIRNYFSRSNGLYHYLNNVYPGNVTDITGQTFWYEIFPSILFLQIYSLYPRTPGMEEELRMTADRWREARVGMGAKSSPWTLPNFDATGYSFHEGKPVDNQMWREPDVAAAIPTQSGAQKSMVPEGSAHTDCGSISRTSWIPLEDVHVGWCTDPKWSMANPKNGVVGPAIYAAGGPIWCAVWQEPTRLEQKQ